MGNQISAGTVLATDGRPAATYHPYGKSELHTTAPCKECCCTPEYRGKERREACRGCGGKRRVPL